MGHIVNFSIPHRNNRRVISQAKKHGHRQGKWVRHDTDMRHNNSLKSRTWGHNNMTLEYIKYLYK